MTPITEAKIKWTAYSCQVINCRAEPKNISSFQHPVFPPDDIHWEWATIKYQEHPTPPHLHATQKVGILFLSFPLQEKKKYLECFLN